MLMYVDQMYLRQVDRIARLIDLRFDTETIMSCWTARHCVIAILASWPELHQMKNILNVKVLLQRRVVHQC
jgi:hypothetical protein